MISQSQFYQFSLGPNLLYSFDSALLGCLGEWREQPHFIKAFFRAAICSRFVNSGFKNIT